MSEKSAVAQFLQRGRAGHYRLAVATMTVNVLIMGMGVVSSVLAARILGPEGRGAMALAVIWTALLSAAAQVGLTQSLTFNAAKAKMTAAQAVSDNPEGDVFVAMLLLLALQSAAVLASGWLVSAAWRGYTAQSVAAIRLFLWTAPLTYLLTYLAALAQGKNEIGSVNLIRLIAASALPMAFLLAKALALTDLNRILLCAILTMALASGAALALFVFRYRPRGRLRREVVKSLLRYGLRSHGGNLAWFVNGRLDQLMIGFLLPTRELGHYAVAVSYAGVAFPVSSALATLIFPSAAMSRSWEEGVRKINRALKASIGLSLVVALTMMLAAPWLIPMAFGSAYQASVGPSLILTLSMAILGCNYVLSDGMRGLGAPGRVSLCEALGLIVTSLGLAILIPTRGITGAAAATLIGCGAVFLLLRRSCFQPPAQRDPEPVALETPLP